MKWIILSVLFCFVICCCGDNGSECNDPVVFDSEAYFTRTTKDSSLILHKLDISGDCLTISVRYGGCNTGHHISLVTDGAVATSLPPQIHFRLVDYDPQECKALIQEEYSYDLAVIDDTAGDSGSIRIIFPDQGKEILWTVN